MIDWTHVILAGIGGGLGAALGSLLARPVGGRTTKSAILIVAVVTGGQLGSQFGPKLIDPIIGPILRDATGQTAAAESEIATLKSDPFFGALMAAKPGVESEIKTRLAEAYRKEGRDGVKRESGLIGVEYGASIFPTYVPRAKDDDLKQAFLVLAGIADELTKSDPELCYVWLFGSKSGQKFDAVKFSNVVGSTRETQLTTAFTAMIQNANPTPVDYNHTAATEGVKRAAAAMVVRLGEQNVPLLSLKRVATTVEEERLVCSATATLYHTAIAQPNAADVLRSLLSKGY